MSPIVTGPQQQHVFNQVWFARSWCARGWRTRVRMCAWWSRWRRCGRRSARAAAARGRPRRRLTPSATRSRSALQWTPRARNSRCAASVSTARIQQGANEQPDGTCYRQFLGLSISALSRLPQRARQFRRRRPARALRRRWPPAWRPLRRCPAALACALPRRTRCSPRRPPPMRRWARPPRPPRRRPKGAQPRTIKELIGILSASLSMRSSSYLLTVPAPCRDKP